MDLFCCPRCQGNLIRKNLNEDLKVFYYCKKCDLKYLVKNDVLILLAQE